MKKTFSFKTASKRIKYLDINLPKEVTYLRARKHYWKKLKETNKWKGTLCSWIGRLDMSILLEVICRLNAILTEIQLSYFCGNIKNPS